MLTKEQRRKYNKDYREFYDDKLIKKWKKEHPERVKIIAKKHDAKRRNLDFVLFNEMFDGAVAHHIDFECVVYIPRGLHTSIPHNVWTGRGMAEINDKVFEWLGGE